MKPQKCLIVHCQQSTLPGWSRKSAIHVCTSSVLPGQPHIRPEYKFSIAFKHCSRLDSLSWEIIGPARHGGACFHLHAWGGGEGWDSVEGGSIESQGLVDLRIRPVPFREWTFAGRVSRPAGESPCSPPDGLREKAKAKRVTPSYMQVNFGFFGANRGSLEAQNFGVEQAAGCTSAWWNDSRVLDSHIQWPILHNA
ncbi:hypothetical protein H102_06994 [Trichophyton rubrum CBS 100081]|nr:hypothetical protein H102_06994 [Trichophyton rubrum CBS 100081]